MNLKFTDGNWMVREGFSIHHPRTVRDIDVEKDSLTLYAPCKDIHHRGATLDGPLLTVKLSSPADNVIRVQTWHYKGGRERFPNFDVARSEERRVGKECLIREATSAETEGVLAQKAAAG